MPTESAALPGRSPGVAALGGAASASAKQVEMGQLSSAQVTAAGKDGAFALVGVLAVSTALAAVLAVVLGSQGHRGSPIDWFHSGVVVLGLAVHAAVELHVSQTGTDAVSGAVTAGLTLMPLLLTLFIVAISYRLAKRNERRHPSASLRECGTQALVAGAAFGGGAALLAAITSGPIGFGTGGWWSDQSVSSSLGVNSWETLLGAFVVVSVGAMLGRSIQFARLHGVSLGQAAGAGWAAWADDARTAWTLSAAVLVAAVLAAVVDGAWHLVPTLWSSSGSTGADAGSGGGSGWRGVVSVVGVGGLMLVNALVTLAGFVMGGTLGMSGGGNARSLLSGSSWSPHVETGVGLLAGGVPAAFYLAWFLLLVVALAVGLRAAFRRGPGVEVAPRAGRVLVLFAAGWALVSWVASVTVRVTGEASALDAQGVAAGHAAAGLGVGSTVGAAVIWALVCVVGGNYLAPWVGAVLPGASVRLAGRRLDPQWSLLLADAAQQRGRRVPTALLGAADALRDGVLPDTPRLDVRPRRVRTFYGVAVAVLVLAVVVPVSYVILDSTVFGADSVAAAYLKDLSRKDTKAALRLVDPSSMRDVDKTLLVPAAVKTPPQLISVVSTKVKNDKATVVVDERIGGQTKRAWFTLARKGHRAGLFDNWVLESPFSDLNVSTEVTSPGSDLSVNGVSTGYSDYAVFPGSYRVDLGKSQLYEAQSSVVTATGASIDPVDLEPAVSQDLQAAADHAVRAALDSCAAEAVEEPLDCPLDYTNYDYDPLTNVSWSITGYPNATVTINDDGSVTVDADDSGAASISGTGTDLDGNPVPVQDTTSISSFSGTLDWEGGDPSTAALAFDY